MNKSSARSLPPLIMKLLSLNICCCTYLGNQDVHSWSCLTKHCCNWYVEHLTTMWVIFTNGSKIQHHFWPQDLFHTSSIPPQDIPAPVSIIALPLFFLQLTIAGIVFDWGRHFQKGTSLFALMYCITYIQCTLYIQHCIPVLYTQVVKLSTSY